MPVKLNSSAGGSVTLDVPATATDTTLTLPVTGGSLAGAGPITTSGLTQNTSRLLGRTTAGTGAVEEITVGAGLSLSGGTLSSTDAGGTVTSVAVSGGATGLTVSGSPITTSGTITLAGTLAASNGGTGATTLAANNVLLGNGTSPLQVVAPGTAGNVLTSNGTTWASATPAGGGSWIWLSTVVANNSATVDIDTNINSTYDVYAIVASNANTSVSGDLQAFFRTAGSYFSADYNSYFATSNASFTGGPVSGSGFASLIGQGSIRMSGNNAISINGPFNFVLFLYSPSVDGIRKSVSFSGVSSAGRGISGCGGCTGFTTPVTGIRFTGPANITSGTFRLYGIKNS
jgi:hypothetical protein